MDFVKLILDHNVKMIFSGGARGPGVFFIIPCVDTYEKIDMRSRKYEIPPQEVNRKLKRSNRIFFNASCQPPFIFSFSDRYIKVSGLIQIIFYIRS